MPSDCLSQGFIIPPGALGTIPESARPVQVREQVAKKPPVYTLKCPKSVILGQFRVLTGVFFATCSCTCTGLTLSGTVPNAPGGILKPCNKLSKGMTTKAWNFAWNQSGKTDFVLGCQLFHDYHDVHSCHHFGLATVSNLELFENFRNCETLENFGNFEI